MAAPDPGAAPPRFAIRPWRPDDENGVAALALRLTVGLPPWRDPLPWAAAAQGWVRTWAARASSADDQAVFVATAADGRCVGFVDVAARRHFTGAEEAYVGELVVAEDVEGQGLGSRLLSEAERWAHQRGLGMIALDASMGSARARALYGRRGFAEESVRLVKMLPPGPRPGE